MRTFAHAQQAPQRVPPAREPLTARPHLTRQGHDASPDRGLVPGRQLHDFSRVRVHALPAAAAGRALAVPARRTAGIDLPGAAGTEEIVDQPAGGSAGPAPAPASGDSCGQPRSMNKLTSGTFLGSVTMDTYYPRYAGGAFYRHPGSGGEFDTGSRAGANVQLYGVIPSPCLPHQYHFEQTFTRTRYRINGAIHPEEGLTFDDIAKSGGDYTRPPRRQEFLGGGAAPLGYIVTMADPPSIAYTATSNIELDRAFVTTLVGPSGRQSVSWSLSTRIAAGVVTRNVLT